MSTEPSINNSLSLDNLYDIVESAPVSLWWPLAPGWWVLIALLTVAALIGLCRFLLKRHRNAYRRWALKELDALEEPGMLPTLLKRVALAAYPREEVGALSGRAWLSFLNGQVPGCFDAECSELLLQLDYRSDTDLSNAELVRLRHAVRRWTLAHPDRRARK